MSFIDLSESLLPHPPIHFHGFLARGGFLFSVGDFFNALFGVLFEGVDFEFFAFVLLEAFQDTVSEGSVFNGFSVDVDSF